MYVEDRRALFDGSTSVFVGRSGASPDLVYKLSINCRLPSQVPFRCPGCTNFMQPLSACVGVAPSPYDVL